MLLVYCAAKIKSASFRYATLVYQSLEAYTYLLLVVVLLFLGYCYVAQTHHLLTGLRCSQALNRVSNLDKEFPGGLPVWKPRNVAMLILVTCYQR
jgi:hypothetical protein